MVEDTSARQRLSRADVGARMWALLIDLTLLGIAAVVAMFGTVIASAPFWKVNGQTYGTGGGAGSTVLALNQTIPAWVSWVVLAVLAVAAVVLSGALARPGKRRSLGMMFAELCLASAGKDVVDTDVPDPSEHWDSASLEPQRWRVAARWVLPLVVFAVLAPLAGAFLAGAVTVGLWSPALFGSRRSAYDRVVGVVVVDPVRSIRRSQDAAKARGRAAR